MNIVREGEIKWQASAVSPGAATAIVWGNPAVPGQPYVQRVRFSPLKGTWWVGHGPKWDKDATTPVPAGSFVVHHAERHIRVDERGAAQK
jgi:hypothetical protein